MTTRGSEAIYLDNAATSFPKPERVYRAVNEYMRQVGASAGRGAYGEAREAEKILETVRAKLLRLLGASERGRVVFALNATDAINTALKGLLDEGDHVVTTHLDHNSVLRPLNALEKKGFISVARVPCSPEGFVDPGDIKRAVTGKTRLIATLHGSNILGTLNPVDDIGRIAREEGVLFLLDAAQTVGSRPVYPEKIGAHLVAFPGHKGLLGPLGTGALYFDKAVDPAPLREGGTGSRSESDAQPEEYPDRWEAGSHNLPGIVGLNAGLDYIAERGLDDIHRKKTRLAGLLLDGLSGRKSVTLYGPTDPADREAVFSLNLQGIAPHELGAFLDSEFNIKGRAGLHCAPLAHKAAGTFEQGSYRLSIGPLNEEEQISRVMEGLDYAVREFSERIAHGL